MKFYCIIDSPDHIHNPEAFDFLRQACEARDVTFVPLAADDFDYSTDPTVFLESGALLYRLSISSRSRLLEKLIRRNDTISLHEALPATATTSDWGSVISLLHAGLPIIPTIFGVSVLHVDRLDEYVQRLGGFPVILKATGGSHGQSVMRVDSVESLRSVIGFVTNKASAEFALRKYIHSAQHIRCVVVGDRVVDAVRYLPQPGDFRTNANATPQVEAFTRTAQTEEVFALAEKAVAHRGYALGGVDILIDEQQKLHIAEVNAPCNFARNQMHTGTDIGGAIVEYLMAKAAQNS